jgi:Protein of unknown function (DUF2530)
MAKPLKEVPPPLEGNDQRIAAIGAAVWAVALILVTALALSGDLPASRHWWIWTCVTGVGLGVFAMLVIPWIKRGKTPRPAGPPRSGRPGGS